MFTIDAVKPQRWLGKDIFKRDLKLLKRPLATANVTSGAIVTEPVD